MPFIVFVLGKGEEAAHSSSSFSLGQQETPRAFGAHTDQSHWPGAAPSLCSRALSRRDVPEPMVISDGTDTDSVAGPLSRAPCALTMLVTALDLLLSTRWGRGA